MERLNKEYALPFRGGFAYPVSYIDQFLYETTSYSWKRMKELEILCSEEAAALLQRYQIQLCTYKEV